MSEPSPLRPSILLTFSAGGFPCQDLSVAGKQAGLEGDRSGLFYEMARIVREIRPRIWIMENVPNIVNIGLSAVLSEVAACGYDARWGMLRADNPLVDAPHRRERWFCVAWLADNDRKRGTARARLPAIKRADLPDTDRGDGRGSSVADSDGAGRQKQQPATVPGGVGHDTRRSPAHRGAGVSKSGMGGEPDGIPARLDSPHRWPAPPGPQHAWEPPRTRPRQPHDRERLTALGNAVVPACAEIIGRFIASELLDLS